MSTALPSSTLLQPAADLVPLSMVQETLDSDMNLHVVAIHLAQGHFKAESFGPSRHQFSRGLSAARLADEHSLVREEIAVLQCDDPMFDIQPSFDAVGIVSINPR